MRCQVLAVKLLAQMKSKRICQSRKWLRLTLDQILSLCRTRGFRRLNKPSLAKWTNTCTSLDLPGRTTNLNLRQSLLTWPLLKALSNRRLKSRRWSVEDRLWVRVDSTQPRQAEVQPCIREDLWEKVQVKALPWPDMHQPALVRRVNQEHKLSEKFHKVTKRNSSQDFLSSLKVRASEDLQLALS